MGRRPLARRAARGRASDGAANESQDGPGGLGGVVPTKEDGVPSLIVAGVGVATSCKQRRMLQGCLLRCTELLPTKYETPRISRMPSKPLAAAHACIVAFVVLFYIGYMFKAQKYLALEVPDGTARLRLQAVTPEPGFPGFLDPEQLPYCDGGTPEPGQIRNIAQNFSGSGALTRPCQYRDEFFAAYPQVEHNALFATTRVTEKVQRVPPNCDNAGGRRSKDCAEWITDSTDVFYVSQLEDFTLLIDHSFIASLSKTSAASFDPRVEAVSSPLKKSVHLATHLPAIVHRDSFGRAHSAG